MTRHMPDKNRGFTLIEMLLAIALSALLLVTVYSTYFSIARSIDTTLGTQELLETGRILLEMLKRDIRGIGGKRFPLISTVQEIDGKSVTDIVFVTSAPGSANAFKWSKVGYALTQDPKGQWIFIKKEASNPNDDLDQLGRVFEISRLVSSFRLAFFDGSEWVEQWDSRSTGKLPKQVRITVEISDDKKNVQTYTAEEAIASAL
jgi:general secretion pathway protein J